jgi:hypothetical protein
MDAERLSRRALTATLLVPLRSLVLVLASQEAKPLLRNYA